MDYPHLKHAPIEEAIIGLFTEYDLRLLESSLETLRSRFADQFPQNDPLKINQASFELNEETCHVLDTKISEGRVFKNEDKRQFLVLDGSTIRYHQLKPYSNWKTFTQEFFQIFNVLQSVFSLREEVTPFIRFINKLEGDDISKLNFSFKQSLLSLNQDKEAVFERAFYATEVRSEKYRSTGRVLVNVQKNDSDEIEYIMFDIDLKSISSIPEVRQVALNAHFDSLREFKNDVFFSNIKKVEEVFG
jgi:uncharacterized protein (TIGR04255 family)